MFSLPTEIYLHCLTIAASLNYSRISKLLSSFPDAKTAWGAEAEKLAAAGLEREEISNFDRLRRSLNLSQELEKLQHQSISLIGQNSPHYPALLTQIPQPPRLLYMRGYLPQADELCVAVIGTRNITAYGRTVIPYLIGPIIDSGTVVVSGLAFGVDSAVQQLAVEKGKRTVAILGGGVDEKTIYPKEHTWLAQRILETGGLLASEYPPGTPPLRHHFIARNRIISGWSAATVVVECDTKSGSLITAKYALDQNRSLFAVPGPIYAQTSQGPNSLIRMGARPLLEPKDLFEELNLDSASQKQEPFELFGDSPAESAILHALGSEPLAADVIIKSCGLPASDVTSALTFLEMKGRVKNLGGQQYTLSR